MWGRLSLLLDVASEMPYANGLLDLVLYVIAFFGVMVVVVMEVIILGAIFELAWSLHRVGCPQETPLSNMEEDLCSG